MSCIPHIPLELVVDQFGTTMELFRCPNGRLVASDMQPDMVYNMRDIRLRPDDIMLCSYSKSGCHWLWEVLRCLVAGTTQLPDNVDKETYMIEFNRPESLDKLPSPRVLNNHGLFEDQPRDLLEKQVKVVLIYRNLKDVAVSYYHHHTRCREYKYQDTFSHYLRRLVAGLVDNGSIFEYLKSWEAGILNTPEMRVHLVSYEDMKEDPVREFQHLSQFLDTRRDLDFLREVAQATDFRVMQERKITSTPFFDQDGLPVMYRKGQVGDWVNHFTVADSHWLDNIIQQELAASKLFHFRYSIPGGKSGSKLSDSQASILEESQDSVFTI